MELASASDDELIAYANTKRRALPCAPEQSFFRVYVLLIVRSEDRNVIIEGTNAEQGYIGGAICAERAALCEMRKYRDPIIVKVVVVTDSDRPVSCGALCREYLSSHGNPATPLVFSNSDGTVVSHCELGYLQPYPYVYRFCKRDEVRQRAVDFSAACQNPSEISQQLGDLYAQAMSVTKLDDFETIHPIKFAAAVLFADGTVSVAWFLPGFEYGCSLDPVSQLIHDCEKKRANAHGDESKVLARPDILLQCDQFGVCHAPFAQARALLTEHGYGDTRIVVHNPANGACELTLACSLLPPLPGGVMLSHSSFASFSR
jgi:cytidine deaminase